MNATIFEVAMWLLATRRRQGRLWEETDAMLERAFPDLDDEKLDDALIMAGEILDGRRSMRWGTA